MSAEYRRVVRPLRREPPPTIEQVAWESRWQRFVVYVARPLWSFRVEVTAAAVVLLAYGSLIRRIGSAWAVGVLAAVAALVTSSTRGRRLVWQVFHRSRLRRRWNLAVRHARLATHDDRIPRPVRIRTVASGDRLRVRVPFGGTVSALEHAAEVIAAVLGVRDVEVSRDRDNARYASVVVVRRDPLAGGDPIPWPEPTSPVLRAVGEESAS
ncbi:MAG: hypothetical protein ACRDJ4_08675 [Actinomycetota bacterium]